MLWVALHFPLLPPGSLEPIAAWACQFTPKVSPEPPQELLLEVEGSLRFFGGIDAVLKKIADGLRDLGFPGALATAPTARAALWLARGEGRTIEELPLAVMRADAGTQEFLRSIGIATVGELLKLPREELARRCGTRLVEDLDRALGTAAEPRTYFAPPPRFAAKLELPAEVTHAQGLLFAARRLLLQLDGLLAAHQAGIRSFDLTLMHSDKTSTLVRVSLASPARDAERLARLLSERLARVALARPVQAIRLEADGFTPLHGRTAGMFGDAAAESEGWARLLERLRARLGHDAVSGLATHADHRPEHAWRRVEPGEWDPHEFRQPGPRPSWLLHPPRAIPENSFALLAGPERIESGWWDGDQASRDYFIAQSDESLIWVYREAGEWFVHGLFA